MVDLADTGNLRAEWLQYRAQLYDRDVGLGRQRPDLARQVPRWLQDLLSTRSEALWLVLIGHGTFDGKTARFGLRGPDVTPAEWAVCLGVGMLVAALVWFIASRLYHREQLAISA